MVVLAPVERIPTIMILLDCWKRIQEVHTEPPSEGHLENQENNENNDDNVRDDGIGIEAQSLLNIHNEIARPTNFFGLWRRGNFLLILYFIPVTVALLTVLVVDWQSACDRPLRAWVLAQIIIQVMMICIHLFIMYRLPSSLDSNEAQNERMRSLAPVYMVIRILNFLWFTWFIVGLVWTFQALANDTCPSSAPFIFRMCFSLVIIQIVLLSLGVLFCCCSCVVLVLRIVVNPTELRAAPPRGASDALIRSLPAKRYHADLIKKEDASCAICLSEYEEGETVRFLPCHHHYHRNCVDKWLVTNKACPFCKRNIDEPPPPPHTPPSTAPPTDPPSSSSSQSTSDPPSTTSMNV